MALIKILECNHCKKRIPYDERNNEWSQIYSPPPKFSPVYSEDAPLLCPGCSADLETFLAGGKFHYGD